MTKQWVTGHDWPCPACGSEVVILTSATQDPKPDAGKAYFWADDKARCPADDCDWKGSMYACEDDCGVNEGNLMELDEDNRVVING